ncbi:TRAP transporter large permease [Propionivibrio dicarboxylicus]|uniref:TRAP transporter large permease protein n=1 Tax=Propionivibrio dicarboxylicus TaxID=83767 RepID=A0A1G8K0I9_9RHOO|nr:TRAP transporter large permease [Propionivibrio dicarboxylicus]SDI36903.1 TRAP transporter, DctM subunit [Propionivibrio dicarboxylicus]
MEPVTLGVLGLGLMIVLIVMGVHIGISMAVVGFLGMAAITGMDAALGMLQTTPYSTVANYGLSVIVLFVLMGQLAYHSGLSYDLYKASFTWLGHLPGGLAMSTVVACTGIGALCGSTTATTATMGIVALPEMKRFGYQGGFAAATVACAGTLGTMVPPSVLLMLYGVMCSLSIGKLFSAVVIPGLTLLLLYLLVAYLVVLRNPELGPRGPKCSWKERFESLYHVKDLLFLIVLVIGGMLGGFFTVNEGGAVGVLGALVVAGFRRSLSFAMLKQALLDTGKTSAMIFMVITGAMIFGYFLAISRLPGEMAQFFAELPFHRNIVMFGIILLYIFLGALMDELAMLLLTIPIFFPVVAALQFNPYWFGVLLVLVMASGMICPPVGINCFIIAGIDKSIPITQIYKAIWPYWGAIVVMLFLMFLIPDLALWLPSVLM